MNLLDRLSAAADLLIGRGKGASSGPGGGFSLGTSWVSGPRSVDPWGARRAPSPYELIEVYKSLSYTCTNINADAVAAVPLRLCVNTSNGSKVKDISNPAPLTKSQHRYIQRLGYTRSAKTKVNDIHEIRNHPLLSMLDLPDDEGYFDRSKLLKIICKYCDIIGSCYLWPEFSKEGMPPRYLWPVYSQYVLPIHDVGSVKIKTYQYFDEAYTPDQLLIFKHKESLRDPYATGYPPAYAAYEYMRLEDKFVGVQDQLLGMGPRPAMIASPKDSNMPVGEAERQRFEQDLNRKHARGAQGGVIVTNGSWDLQPMSYSPTDLAGLKVAEYDMERICGCWDVPVALFISDTNLANLEASRDSHAERGVRPRCVTIANALTRFARRFDERLFFVFDNCVLSEEEREVKMISMMLADKRISINQANEETEYPPASWGELPWIETNLAQPDTLTKLHEAAIKASDAASKGASMGGGNSALKASDKKKPKGKSNGSSGGSGKSGKSKSARAAGGVDGQADAAVHGRVGLTEGEDRVPFAWERWEGPSASPTQPKVY